MIKARIPKGVLELLPKEQFLFDESKRIIKETYKVFDYNQIETEVFELEEILRAKAGEENDKEIFSFIKGKTNYALRFDLTVPLARYTAEHYHNLTFPFKVSQIGKVYRGERPQKGRYRSFYQCDIDVLGVKDIYYDIEIPFVIYQVMKNLAKHFKNPEFVNLTFNISNRKILNGFLEELNLKEKSSFILKNLDKIDKQGEEKILEELKKEIKEKDLKKIIEFIRIKDNHFERLNNLKISNKTFEEGTEELKTVYENLNKTGIPSEKIKINLRITRGLDYYTGTIYETFFNNYSYLGSISSGGRYDNLINYYSKEKISGVGMSIGLTRLFPEFLKNGFFNNFSKSEKKVLIINCETKVYDYSFKIAELLRAGNIKTNLYLEPVKLSKQLKYADKNNYKYVIIIGEDEIKKETIKLKNMITGEEKNLKKENLLKEFQI